MQIEIMLMANRQQQHNNNDKYYGKSQTTSMQNTDKQCSTPQ